MSAKGVEKDAAAIIKYALLLALLTYKPAEVKCNDDNLTEIIMDLNQAYQIKSNLLIDLNIHEGVQLTQMLADVELPKIIITDPGTGIRELYKHFSMDILTVVKLKAANLNMTFNVMEELLWRRHLSTIVVICDTEYHNGTQALLNLFEEALRRGFTSMLVWRHNNTYTYNPYPRIEVIPLPHYTHFKNRTSWDNFQQETFRVMDVDYPPRCFSYRNHKGHLIRSGHYCKIIENFLNYYNANIQYDFVDIWSVHVHLGVFIVDEAFSFVPNFMPVTDFYESSDSFLFTNVLMMVPTANEINQSLYLSIPFNGTTWLVMFITIGFLTALFYVLNYRSDHRGDLSRSLFQSISVIIFIGINGSKKNSLLDFALCLLFLYSGFFITNFYMCNLSSMYASRIYEPELQSLQDIARTDLHIQASSNEIIEITSVENLPPIVYKRLITSDNRAIYVDRLKLNLTFIQGARTDMIPFLLFQQLYLRKPFVKTIDEPFSSGPMFIGMPYRTTYIERFNRYLGHIIDSGLLQKFMSDSQWDGVISGIIKFFVDDEINRSLSLFYFQDAFIILSMGLLCAAIIFLCEIKCGKRLGRAMHEAEISDDQ